MILSRRSSSGRVAAVTGAGSGIGQALAWGLAARGARLALSDVNAEGLEQTAEQARSSGAQVATAVVDVADQQVVAAWARAVAAQFGVVHQLYNNAGIGCGTAPIDQADYADYRRVLDVNLWGVIHCTKEFLPHILASGAGHVVNVSSLNGLMGQRGLGAYCTSKFAVRGFTDTLRVEMLRDGRKVRVTGVYPAGVKTNIAGGAPPVLDDPVAAAEMQRRLEIYDSKLFKTTSADAATTILDGVEKGRPRVLIGDAGKVDRIIRLMPGAYPRIVAAWDKRTFGA